MLKSLGVIALLALSMTGAGAFDLSELAPCKPAAMRFCDQGGGLTTSNLLRCGATLAAVSHHVGSGCREVLRRYGQLTVQHVRHPFGTVDASLR